ncbi:MAG TPA: carbohydrate ABC transporter permease [Actinomycetota bacterium]|nr:carbohydrate ABC transporter permease [Actinomycetota bacterium]
MAVFRSRLSRRAAYAVTAVMVTALFVVPLVTMATGSLRKPGTPPPRALEIVADPVTIEAYRNAFELAPLARALVNSAFVALIFVPIAVIVASMAGYAIARAAPVARRRAVGALFVLLTIPVTVLWIARFAIFDALGLVGTYVPLIAPALMGGSPFAVLLYAFAFSRIPPELYDAARLEGASELAVWRRVAMPLARGTTAAAGMLAFVQCWSNFIDPLLYLRDERTYTAPLALRYLEQLGPTNWPVLLAGAVVVTVPVVAVFLFAQRAFLQEEKGLAWIGR